MLMEEKGCDLMYCASLSSSRNRTGTPMRRSSSSCAGGSAMFPPLTQLGRSMPKFRFHMGGARRVEPMAPGAM